MLIRLAVLALAAFGAKTLYDHLAPRRGEMRDAGSDFADRATSAAREVGAKVQDAAQRITNTTQESAADVMTTVKEQAGEVRAATEDVIDTTVDASMNAPQSTR